MPESTAGMRENGARMVKLKKPGTAFSTLNLVITHCFQRCLHDVGDFLQHNLGFMHVVPLHKVHAELEQDRLTPAILSRHLDVLSGNAVFE